MVASLLQQAGIDIGSDLVAPNEGNPRGYFEDRRFLRFHEELLRHCPHRFLVQDRSDLEPPGPEAVRHARQLAEYSGGGAWGWKDPRTSLFLDLWAGVLPPEARFLFVFRHPIDVMLSLARRGFRSEVEVTADPLVGLRAWMVYNRSILDFRRRHPDRCFLANVYDVAANPAGFLDAVSRRLGLSLRTGGAEELVHRSELSRSVSNRRLESLLRRLAPETSDLYRELLGESDLPVAESGSRSHGVDDSQAWLDGAELLLSSHAGNEPPVRPFLALIQAILDPRAKPFRGERLRAQLSELEDQIRELEVHSGNLEQKVADLSTALRKNEAHAENLEALHGQAQGQIEQLGHHVSNLEELHRRDLAQVVELERHAQNLEELRRQDRGQIAALETHAGSLEAELERCSRQLTELVAHSRNLEALRDRDSVQAVRLETRIHDLERQLADRDEAARAQAARRRARPRRRRDESTSAFRIRSSSAASTA